MKTITRLYILQILIIGAIIVLLMVFKINSIQRLNLFLKSADIYHNRMVDNIMKMDQEVFMRPLRDNSEWDETVGYIANPTAAFEEECLMTLPTTFSFDHIWVFNQQGTQIFSYAVCETLDLDAFLSDSLIKSTLKPGAPFCHFFITVNSKIIGISGATIVPTSDTGHRSPAKGYLFFGRDCNDQVTRHFEEISGAKIKCTPSSGPPKQSTGENPFTIGYNLLDIKNNPVARLSFSFPTTFVSEWERDTSIFTTINIFLGIFLILIIGLLSRKWFVIPLKSLIESLNTGKTEHLDHLKTAKNEFGEMARLIEDSFFTKKSLQEEIQNRIQSEVVLSALKEKAEESDRLKTAFLSNMSHEIRTPMNCILGFIQLLEQEDFSQEERQKYMAMVNNSGKQLLSIINDILDISRIESNQMKLQPGSFDLNIVLDKLFLFFNNEKQKSGKNDLVIELQKGISNGPCQIYCDSVRLEQILNNLLTNALKFTVSGKIVFGYSCEQNRLLFFVHDTGFGISEQNQKIIFERFRQGEENQTRNFGGTGLGLPISRGLVELMGGKMWLTSERGNGSSFYFSLPDVLFKGEATQGIAPAPGKGPVDLKGKTILIAEDVPENIELIATMLKHTGARILSAVNGQMALDLCRTDNSIDLILMDIQMPVMNGYDATREIKKIKPELPVIALTAYAFDKDKNKCSEAGCNDFLAKPILKKELLEKLDNFLGR